MATLVRARDEGLPLPVAAAPLSSWVDLSCTAETYDTRAAVSLGLADRERLQRYAGLYLDGRDARDPLASPLFADLAGLPSLLIQVGDHETLLGDSRALRARAETAGVEATLEVWDEMVHAWHLFHHRLADGRRAIARLAAFFDAAWSRH
jgi:acetyl esterase/lipase